MKKTAKSFFTVIIAALMIAAPMTVFAFAPVGDISVPYGTPTIDGNLAQGEWSEKNKIVVDQKNASAEGWMGEVPAGTKIDFYYTWDKDNLYLAGIITDPTFFYSASGDNYNGDAFQISLNLGQIFKTADFERAIFYSWGCLEDGTVDVFRQESMDNIVINDVGFSKKLDTGWQFEVAMPWSTLVKDAADKQGTTVTVDAGLRIDALISYMDADDTGARINCFATNKTTTVGWDPDSFGITLNLAAKVEAAPVTDAPAADAPAADTQVTAAAAQTSDTAIFAPALVILAASAVIIATKKR